MITTVRRSVPPRLYAADGRVTPLVSGPRRRARSGRGALVAAAVLLAAVVALIVVRPGSDDGDSSAEMARQRREFLTYAAALDALAKEGGQVVQEGLKRSVVDLTESKASDDDLQATTESNLARIEDVRDDVVALRAPRFLQTTKALYDHALRDYVATARLLVSASRATGDERAALLRLAIDMGEETDDLYEQAERALKRVRAGLGLPPEEEPPS